MPTINQLVKGEGGRQEKDRFAGPEGVPSKTRGVRPGLHHHPKEAELRPQEGGEGALNQRDGGDRLYPRNRAYPPGALGGAGQRRQG